MSGGAPQDFRIVTTEEISGVTVRQSMRSKRLGPRRGVRVTTRVAIYTGLKASTGVYITAIASVNRHP